ncbi:MAG: carboxypeptidase regulatory-like domain-containing protein [Terracidiphilus sp.]
MLAVSAAAQGGSYRIAGTVVNAVTGEPVSGAMVALLTVEDSSTVAATESGGDGHFVLARLPAAKYQLSASKRGYCTGFYDQHDNYNSAIVTGEGQDTGNLVFRLAPEAVLSGVVSGDGGDPAAGATVMLFERPNGHDPGAKIEQAGTTTTDDTGAYEFPDLPAGEYLLAVRAQPWYAINHFDTGLNRQPETEQQAALDVAYPVAFFDSTSDEGSATPIVLSSGSRQQANINLHAVQALHIEVQTPQKADGTLVQPELRQTIFGLNEGGEGGFMSRNRDGSTEFGGVAPGVYELTQGDPPRIVELNANASQQVDPNAGTPAVAVNGTLQPAQGTAVNGAYMLSLEPAGGDASPQPQPTFANQRAFSFRAVPAGAWKLQVSNGLDVVSITADGRTQRGNVLTVQDHALSVVVTVTGGRAVRIEGFARKDGKGFAGAMVVLVPKDLGAMAELSRRDQSDSDGSFGLLNVKPGEYTVVAIEDGWDLDWGNPAVIARYLPGGQAVTVKDSLDNEPVGQPGRRVELPEPVVVQPR